MKWTIFSIVILLLTGTINAQTLDEVSSLKREHQTCLDSGVNMLGCSTLFYEQMDSLLNLAYNNLRKKIMAGERDTLKNEEIHWIKTRDNYFSKRKREFQADMKKEGWGNDMYMILYDEEAEFIGERVIELINRLNK